MKKTRVAGTVAAAVLAALTLTSCGKSEFGVTVNTEKAMMINAERADKDAAFMVGTLEVQDGEQIKAAAELEKGSVRVEIIKAPEGQSIDEVPDMDGEAVITGNLRSTDAVSGTVPAGNYTLRATCLERATGTIWVTVDPVS